nr:hypothetical protein [Tanacetum cinerariifolium]
ADKVVTKRGIGKEDGRKKRKVRMGALVQQDSEHVSFPTSLHHAKPLETLANMEHVSPNASAGRMGIQENVDVASADEGHGDNEDLRLETVEKPIRDKAVPKVEASYSAGHFGVRNETTIKRSWKLLCQSAQQQVNVLLHFKALSEEHVDLVYAHDSCKDVLDNKKKKKRKAEDKAAAHAGDADIQADKVVKKRGVGKEDGRKKRKVRMGALVQQDSEHVSFPTSLHHAKPLETLANMEHVSPNASAGRMGAL